MYIIVGLGNPEKDYSETRHNMGFNVINKLAKQYEIDISRKKFNSEYGTGNIENEKVILIKPQTYMNNSGEAVAEFFNFYKEEIDKLIIIYDDIDIDIEKIRIRKEGSPGSHNGMKSVVHFLNREDFPRIRVGIGKPEYEDDMINYVIGAIPEEEKEKLEIGMEKAKEAVIEIMKNGIDSAMNKYN